MKEYLISGIQPDGIGVSDLRQSWDWAIFTSSGWIAPFSRRLRRS
ncbi:MAG: hypothetical protein U0X39_03795 [Bacteroidales bacterium]